MTSSTTFYNLTAIRELLLAAFAPEDLRRLCQDEPLLRPVLSQFSPKDSLNDVVAHLSDYCHDNQIWDTLLAGVQQANPNQYARFEPRLFEPESDIGTVPRPLLDACRAQVSGVLTDLRHKYDSSLYVNRAIERDIETFFDTPLEGPSPNCFLIVAPAGSGKTNLLCDLARRRVAHQPVVILMGGSLYLRGDTGLLGAIQVEIEAAGSQVRFHSAADCLHSLHRLASELNRDILLFIDAINEHNNPDDMKKALGNLFRATRGYRIKLLVTCRDYYWGLFQADFWQAALANRPPVEPDTEEAGESQTKEDFSRFAAGEHERALALYLKHYQIIGRPVADAADQCRHPLLLRFFCEAYCGQEVGEVKDIRLKELFDRYWDRKLASIADLMTKHRLREREWLGSADLAAAVGDYLLNVAAYMLHRNVRAIPLSEISKAGGREEQPADRRSYYGCIRDEFIILEEVERGEGRRRTRHVAFVYEEFMEYVMARSLMHDWDRDKVDDKAILAEIEKLTDKYESFVQILGVIVYLSLTLKEQRGLALWPSLLNLGGKWREVVFETFRKLPKDQLDAAVFDCLTEMLNSGQKDIQQQVLDTLKLKRVGQTAPRSVITLVARFADSEDESLARRAALVLGHTESDLAIPVLSALARHAASSSARQNAAKSLRKLGDARAVEPLIAALRDSNGTVRCLAVEALGALGDARAVEPLIAALRDSNKDVRLAATRALGHLRDARAVEPLITALKDSNKELRLSATEALGSLRDARAVEPLIAALTDSEGMVRWSATKTLGCLGDARAVEPLITALRDSEIIVRLSATEALGSLRDARAVEPLIAALTDSEKNVRCLAAEVLGSLGDARAVEPLIAALRDSEGMVGWSAAKALMRLRDARGMQPLIDLLGDSEDDVRWCTSRALRELGDARAVEPLIAALRDSNKDVRLSATEALGSLRDARAVEPLIAALKDSNKDVRLSATEALGSLRDARAVEPLIAALMDSEETVRWSATKTLGCLGDARAVEPLIAALSDSREHMRREVVAALVKLGDITVGPLIAVLTDSDVQVRRGAAAAIRKVGDARAVEPLITALKDSDAMVRQHATEALGKLGNGRAVEPLIAALRDSNRGVQRGAAAALGKLGDARAIEPLISALTDSNTGVWRGAAAALGKLGNIAMERLVDALEDSRWEMRRGAAAALGKTGDARSVDLLIATIRDSQWEVRQSAVMALGDLEDARAVKPLIGALKDDDWGVQRSAQEALRRIGSPEALAVIGEYLMRRRYHGY